jgi:hypothetical protein
MVEIIEVTVTRISRFRGPISWVLLSALHELPPDYWCHEPEI